MVDSFVERDIGRLGGTLLGHSLTYGFHFWSPDTSAGKVELGLDLEEDHLVSDGRAGRPRGEQRTSVFEGILESEMRNSGVGHVNPLTPLGTSRGISRRARRDNNGR